MTVTFEQAMYLCALAAIFGFLLCAAIHSGIRSWRWLRRQEGSAVMSTNPEISHVAPQRFGVMSEKQREKLRQLNPKFAEMEDIRIANDRDAEKARIEAMMAKPIEAGMAEVGS